MITNDRIQEWVENGIITSKQADRIRQDIERQKKEKSSNNIIVALSSIGSIGLGIGIILFIGSNWQYISDGLKVLLLLAMMSATLILGYTLTYEKKTYPRVGMSLLCLSALIYSATIFLVAQIYHVNAHNHWLILCCLIGIAPLTYTIKTSMMASLFLWGTYLWIGFVALRSFAFDDSQQSFVGLPALFISVGTVLFYLSGFQYQFPSLQKISRTYRLITINMTLLCLLLLTITFISGQVETYYLNKKVIDAYSQIAKTAMILSGISIFLSFWYAWKNPTSSRTVIWETGIGIGVSLITSIFLVSPRTTDLFSYLFSLVFIIFAGSTLIVGYQREDLKLINMGMWYTSIFIMIKYFDLFSDLLEQSLLFMIGGIILLGGGFFMEKTRRSMKESFQKKEPSVLETYL